MDKYNAIELVSVGTGFLASCGFCGVVNKIVDNCFEDSFLKGVGATFAGSAVSVAGSLALMAGGLIAGTKINKKLAAKELQKEEG